MNTIKPAAECVSPIQIIAKGIHANGGIGRNTSIIASKALFAVLNQPISIPTAIPTTAPAPKPIAKCRRLVQISIGIKSNNSK